MRLILHAPTQLASERELSEGPVMRCAVEESFVGVAKNSITDVRETNSVGQWMYRRLALGCRAMLS